jgi:hypothetical protein
MAVVTILFMNIGTLHNTLVQILKVNIHLTTKELLKMKQYKTEKERRTFNGIVLLSALETARVYYDAQVADEQEFIINRLKVVKEYANTRKERRDADKAIDKAKQQFKRKTEHYDKFFKKFIDDFTDKSEKHERVIEVVKDAFSEFLSRLLRVEGSVVLVEQCPNRFLKTIQDYANDLNLTQTEVKEQIKNGEIEALTWNKEKRIVF